MCRVRRKTGGALKREEKRDDEEISYGYRIGSLGRAA